MDDNWQYTAVEITKYNPAYRDINGHYTKDEWIGFFQIGKMFEDGMLTFDAYLKTETKYIQAAMLFFDFHGCNTIILKSIEKKGIRGYNYEDRETLIAFYDQISEGCSIGIEKVGILVKLILRELIWAELFSSHTEDIAVRFGWDFYMTFNSDRNMDDLLRKISELGLYIGR